MTPEQLAQAIEQGALEHQDVDVSFIDLTLIGALFVVAQKDIVRALEVIDQLIANKPDVCAAMREQMTMFLTKVGVQIFSDPTTKMSSYTAPYVYLMRMTGRVYGQCGSALGIGDDGTWSITDQTVRTATTSLIAQAMKSEGYASDILFLLPAAIVHNEDIISVIRAGLVDFAVFFALVRKSRDGSDATRDLCRAIAADLAERGDQSIRQLAQKASISIDTISLFSMPGYIQDVYLSHEYDEFILQMKDIYVLNDAQIKLMNELIVRIWAKRIPVEQLKEQIEKICAFNDERTTLCTRDIVLNAVFLFPEYFGDQSSLYTSLGGDPKTDIEGSRLYTAIQRIVSDSLEKIVMSTTIKDIEKEKGDMKALFQSSLVEHFYTNGSYLPALNNTILYLLNFVDGYEKELLDALYTNSQKIGNVRLNGEDPTVANWIKYYLGFSGGTVSSISFAKYLTQDKNVIELSLRDKEALRRLLETFAVLKNFPESLEKTPPEQWMIIPYHLAEEESKVASAKSEVTPSSPEMSVEQPQSPAPAPSIPTQLEPSVPEQQKISQTLSQASIPPETTGSLVGVQDDTSKKIVETTAPPIEAVVPVPSSPVGITSEAAVAQDNLSKISESSLQAIPIDYDALADAVLTHTGMTLSDDIKDRVKKVIVTRVRNVRNALEAKHRLIAPLAEGGAGLSSDDADTILKEAAGALQTITNGTVDAYLPPKIISQAPELPVPITAVSEKEEAPALMIKEVDGVPTIVEKKTTKKKETPTELAQQKKEDQKTIEPQTPSVSHEEEIKKESATPAPVPLEVPPHLEGAKEIPITVRGTPSAAAPKAKIADIAPTTRLVGIVDELRALTMKDFRRLSENPAEAAKRIEQKIDLYGKQSLSKRAEAIQAWKESDIYALYLEIGQVALGKDMTQFSEERKKAGKEYLTAAEFDALLDLNEKLRF